jgi:hypothetical protein
VFGNEITKCPHVYWDEEKDCAVCKVHSKHWFKDTPYFQHRLEEKCKIGQYIMSNPELKRKHKEKYF